MKVINGEFKVYKDGIYHGIAKTYEPLTWLKNFANNRFNKRGISLEGFANGKYYFWIEDIKLEALANAE